jgi:hypothetical protein
MASEPEIAGFAREVGVALASRSDQFTPGNCLSGGGYCNPFHVDPVPGEARDANGEIVGKGDPVAPTGALPVAPPAGVVMDGVACPAGGATVSLT